MTNPKRPQEQPGGAPIGSRQGEAPETTEETGMENRTRAPEKRSERARLIDDPNLNQAGNDRGSSDQAQGSQTGNDID